VEENGLAVAAGAQDHHVLAVLDEGDDAFGLRRLFFRVLAAVIGRVQTGILDPAAGHGVDEKRGDALPLAAAQPGFVRQTVAAGPYWRSNSSSPPPKAVHR
jgi:hypothetical protein